MKKTSLFAALMLALPLSDTAFSASFNCAKAGSANEKIICGDTELSAMDDRLGKIFKAARAKAANRRTFMTESDKQWRWREDNCRDRTCLLRWYQRRETELLALADGSLEAAVKVPATAQQAAPAPAPAPVVAQVKPAELPEPVAENKPAEVVPAPVVADVPAKAAAPIDVPAPTLTPPAIRHEAAPPTMATAEPVKVAPTPKKTAALAPALASQAPAVPTIAAAKEEPSLRSRLSSLKLADMAVGNALPKPHYTQVNQGEYTYEDPRIDPASGKPGTIGVRYLGIENGQYIIEAAQREGILRYTCSADCRFINKLLLPGDVKRDTVVLDNDNISVASLIVNDVINGLLVPSRPH